MIHSVSSATYLLVSLPLPVSDATLQITAKPMYAKSTGVAREPTLTSHGWCVSHHGITSSADRSVEFHGNSERSLAAMLDQRGLSRRAAPRPATEEPSVAQLLEVDHEYREKAAADTLPKIAPKRLNPSGEAWLPILHASRGEWHFTVLFSNTARAHEFGKTRDWVVIYFYDDGHVEKQRTVVTEGRGALAGRRVVRGREDECRGHYLGSR